MKLGIHTEALWRTIDKMKFEAKKHNLVVFTLTPANYEYVSSCLGFKGSKKEFESLLLRCLNELKTNCEIQLHLHLAFFPNWLTYSNQEKMFKESFFWMKQNGFKVSKITFGWWQFNRDSVELAKKYKLEIIRKKHLPAIHDYDDFSASNLFRARLRRMKAILSRSKQ